jgi:hypothetical protein
MNPSGKPCKDCFALGERFRPDPPRPAPYPGPRCATHNRAVVKARKEVQHDQHLQRTYGVPSGEYSRLLEAQGGVCAGCGPRTKRSGKTKRLAVDHDHLTGQVRGLLCGDCNKVIGLFRDDADTFQRLADYLRVWQKES